MRLTRVTGGLSGYGWLMAADKDTGRDATDADSSGAGDDDAVDGRDPDQPMNEAQRTYLEPLAESQDEEFCDDMNEQEAANKIDSLQEQAVSVF